MSAISFPRAQNGGITALDDISYSTVQVQVNENWYDVTGSDGAGAASVYKLFCSGLPIQQVQFQGSARPGGECAKGQNSTATLGTTLIKPQRLTVGRSWPLDDVTGSGDDEKGWSNGIGNVFGSVSGRVLANGPLIATASQTYSFDIDQIGVLATGSGGGTVDRNTATMPFLRGGTIVSDLGFRFNGAWTYTADGTIDIDSVLAHTVLHPPRVDVTLDLDTGEEITHEALMHYFAMTVDFQNGGPIGVTGRYRFDQSTSSS